jgi:hypothetical protein
MICRSINKTMPRRKWPAESHYGNDHDDLPYLRNHRTRLAGCCSGTNKAAKRSNRPVGGPHSRARFGDTRTLIGQRRDRSQILKTPKVRFALKNGLVSASRLPVAEQCTIARTDEPPPCRQHRFTSRLLSGALPRKPSSFGSEPSSQQDSCHHDG